MTIVDICGLCRDIWDPVMNRCFQMFPCLADPARRSSLYLKLALVTIHLVYVAVLFLFDGTLIEKTKKEPWYTALYLLLFAATLIQYFVTSASSPGYVLDAMAAVNEANQIYQKTSITSNQPASSKNGSFIVTFDGSQMGRNIAGGNSTAWSKLVTDLYPPGTAIRTWTCSYCHVEQPPRSKHCHDCDKCILQFDHHCVWLGNCIGQNNHCQFWWYLCEETALCLWTGILYISYLKTQIPRIWWKDAIMILLLITLSISLVFLVLLLLFHRSSNYHLMRRCARWPMCWCVIAHDATPPAFVCLEVVVGLHSVEPSPLPSLVGPCLWCLMPPSDVLHFWLLSSSVIHLLSPSRAAFNLNSLCLMMLKPLQPKSRLSYSDKSDYLRTCEKKEDFLPKGDSRKSVSF